MARPAAVTPTRYQAQYGSINSHLRQAKESPATSAARQDFRQRIQLEAEDALEDRFVPKLAKAAAYNAALTLTHNLGRIPTDHEDLRGVIKTAAEFEAAYLAQRLAESGTNGIMFPRVVIPPTPDALMSFSDTQLTAPTVTTALAKLSHDYAHVLQVHDAQNQRYDDVARHFDWPIPKALDAIQRARTTLANEIERAVPAESRRALSDFRVHAVWRISSRHRDAVFRRALLNEPFESVAAALETDPEDIHNLVTDAGDELAQLARREPGLRSVAAKLASSVIERPAGQPGPTQNAELAESTRRLDAFYTTRDNVARRSRVVPLSNWFDSKDHSWEIEAYSPEVFDDQLFQAALKKLTPLQASILERHDRDGETYREIAEKDGVSTDLVITALKEARLQTAKFLASHGEFYSPRFQTHLWMRLPDRYRKTLFDFFIQRKDAATIGQSEGTFPGGLHYVKRRLEKIARDTGYDAAADEIGRWNKRAWSDERQVIAAILRAHAIAGNRILADGRFRDVAGNPRHPMQKVGRLLASARQAVLTYQHFGGVWASAVNAAFASHPDPSVNGLTYERNVLRAGRGTPEYITDIIRMAQEELGQRPGSRMIQTIVSSKPRGKRSWVEDELCYCLHRVNRGLVPEFPNWTTALKAATNAAS